MVSGQSIKKSIAPRLDFEIQKRNSGLMRLPWASAVAPLAARREGNTIHSMKRAIAEGQPSRSSAQGLAGKLARLIRAAISHGGWLVPATLLAGLAVTAVIARHHKLDADEEAKQVFGFVCSEVELRVKERLREHEQILRSGAGFFADDDGVTREEWHEYAERQKLGQKLPGIQGLGFAKHATREQLAQLTQRVRAEGFPEFRVWPEGEREACSSIIFLEPFAGRNLRAFGYDMLTEPVRRAAMERARDQDEVALSGKVILVQETDREVQAGALMYAPVYRMGEPHQTVAERRAAFLGWVYSPYRMNDLMEGILGGGADRAKVDLKIYDGESPSPEALLYSSGSGAGKESASAIRLTREVPIDSAGRRWLLCFAQRGGADYSMVWIVLAGGTTLSLLLSGLVLSLVGTRFAAWRIAERLTADLSANQKRLQNIIDSASEYVWELDRDGTFTYVSPRAANVLGRPVAQILGSKLFDLLPEEERAVLPEFFKEQAEKGEPFENLRHRVLLPDGSVVLQKITGQPIVGKTGKLQGFVGMAMDVTEEEKARAQQAHDRERIETFFEVAIDLLCIVDTEGKFVRVSQAWKDLIGQPSRSIEGTRFMDYVHPDDIASTHEVFVQMQSGQPLVGFVNRYRTKSGEWRSIEWRAKLIRGNVFAAARDVTDAKAAETALELALERERETTKIKSRLVSMASHEFRTPLATIRLAADLLATRRDKMDEEGIQRTLQAILNTTDYMTGIVTDVLDLSSITRDGQPEALTDFPLGDFLRQIAGEFHRATSTPPAITFEWDGTPVICAGIPVLLKRAVNNLLDNAVKYSPPGMPVVLRLQQEGESALVQVEDQGIGIPEEDRAFLNDPFFRASNTVSIPGTGLGLAIVAEALQRINGTLEHANRPEGGSIFSIRLPLAGGSSGTSPAALVEDQKSAGRLTALRRPDRHDTKMTSLGLTPPE